MKKLISEERYLAPACEIVSVDSSAFCISTPVENESFQNGEEFNFM